MAKICSWTLAERVNLIKKYEASGMSKVKFAKIHSIPRTSLNNILASKEKLYDSLQTTDGSKRKRLRKSNFQDIETALLKWLIRAKAENEPISGIILREKACEIAKEIGNHEFLASNGWIERFKQRHGLSFRKIDFASVEEWKNTVLQDLLHLYPPSNIYNLIEAKLFLHIPEKTSKKCASSKKRKDQITVVLGVNVTGTDKLKPLVIGKCSKPECFENVNIESLPVAYRVNSKACMSPEIWQELIKELDQKFENENRNVAIIVDNRTANREIEGLKAIELILMSQNVASVLQPLNQEIILNFKTSYQKLLASNDKCNFNASIQYIFKSWLDVSAKTIKNSFKHADFFLGKTESETANCRKNYEIDDVSNTSEASIADIVVEVEPITADSDDINSENGTENSFEKPPTKNEALQSIEIIRKYILSIKETTQKDHESLYQLESRINGS